MYKVEVTCQKGQLEYLLEKLLNMDCVMAVDYHAFNEQGIATNRIQKATRPVSASKVASKQTRKSNTAFAILNKIIEKTVAVDETFKPNKILGIALDRGISKGNFYSQLRALVDAGKLKKEEAVGVYTRAA